MPNNLNSSATNGNSTSSAVNPAIPQQYQPLPYPYSTPHQQPQQHNLQAYSTSSRPNSSPSPTIQPQQQPTPQSGPGFRLPSIHSLDIPSFPSTNRPSIPQSNTAQYLPPFQYNKTSPKVLFPKQEQQQHSQASHLMSPISSPYNSEASIMSRSRSSSDPIRFKSEFASPSPLNQSAAQRQPQYLQPPSPPSMMMPSPQPQYNYAAPVVNPTASNVSMMMNTDSSSDEMMSTAPTSANSSPSPIPSNATNTAARRNWKPRKKRQCPECKLFFSNLATHKSTHLKPTNRPHICKYCQRGFARPNDLFRHVKCHWKEIGSDKGQFKCPFKLLEDGNTTGSTDHCCHNTGIFSRCDTFKNHLKAIHFQYPNGTKKDQRTKVNGKCRMCQMEFSNVDDWLLNHIQKNQCPFTINIINKE